MSRPLFLGTLQGSEAPDERRQRLHLTDEDRKTGLHVIGAPKTGKSKFLEHLVRQDIRNSQGLALIDPHGSLYEDVLEWCAYVRPLRRIIPLNLSLGEHIIGFNPFIRQPGDAGAQAERCLDAAVKAWGRSTADDSPRLERVMTALFQAIIENDDLTLLEAHYFLTHQLKAIRERLVAQIEGEEARGNWLDIHASKTLEQFLSQVESSRNRVARFTRARATRRFLALTDPAMNLDVRKIMDEGAVLLVNLKTRPNGLTRSNQRLIGTLLVNAFVDAALGRDANPDRAPRPFHLYLDEFHNFVTADVGEAVTQVRKFGLTFILAHQTLHQVRREGADILDELLGAVKARAVFGGLSAKDAAELAPEIFPGQTDYTEVKYMRETVKFWPVYGREQTITDGTAHTETQATGHTDMRSHSRGGAHTEATGGAAMSGEGLSSLSSVGHSVPYLDGFPAAGGMSFDSTGWGRITTSADTSTWMSADTTSYAETEGSADTTSQGRADSTSRAIGDIPIYHPVAYVEQQPEHYSLEEQRQRQADLLMLQYQRHCFLRPPNGDAKPLLVPHVARFKLSPKLVRQYEAMKAKEAGALTPKEVDAIIARRQARIEQQAREVFDHSGTGDVHSPAHDQQPQRINLDDAVRPAKAGAREPEGQVSPLSGKRCTR